MTTPHSPSPIQSQSPAISVISLEEKHQASLEDSSFCEKKALDLLSKIDSHIQSSHPCVWHAPELKDYVLKTAKDLDALPLEAKKAMPLFGLTFSLKDLFSTKGLTTTAGSRMLSSYKPLFDATVFSTLKEKGSLLVAKTALDEFAMGSYTSTSFLGKTSLVGKSDYSAGGSSGGAASSLKAQLCDFAIGSDTGGSVRQPASHAGLVGFKPTYGGFSRFGMVAYASSLDQAGIFTHTVKDLDYLISSGIAIKDSQDMTSTGITISPHIKSKTPSELKIGYFPFLLDPEGEAIEGSVYLAYKRQLDKYKELGATLIPIDESQVSMMHHSAQIYYIIACAEASSCLSRYQGVFFGESLPSFVTKHKLERLDYWQSVAKFRSEFLGPEAQTRIMLGSYILSSENYDSMYLKSQLARDLLKKELAALFESVDYLCLPVSPTPALKWEQIDKITPAQSYMADFLTTPFSLAGLPAMSLPSSQTSDGLDIGMQIVGPASCDAQMIKDFALIESLLSASAK